MNVSVVIPAYRARDALRLLLLGLARCTLDGRHSLQVVVVDDGSDDGTGDMVAEVTVGYELTYLFIPRTAESGRAAARNAGIAAATGELVVFVDADQVVPPGFLAAHVRAHEASRELVVVGPRHDIEPVDPEAYAAGAPPVVTGGDHRELLLAVFSDNFNNLATCWYWLFSCNVSVRREYLTAVGGFDTGYRGWGLEDSDLGYRLRRHGLAFAWQPTTVLYHQRAQHVTPEMYQQWRANLTYLIGRYDTPETAVAAVMDPENGQRLDWLDAAQRFEYACRALQGRCPRPVTLDVIDVQDVALSDVLAGLPGFAATADLLVVDHTGGDVVAAAVQSTKTDRELLYLRGPDPQRRAEILARYEVAR